MCPRLSAMMESLHRIPPPGANELFCDPGSAVSYQPFHHHHGSAWNPHQPRSNWKSNQPPGNSDIIGIARPPKPGGHGHLVSGHPRVVPEEQSRAEQGQRTDSTSPAETTGCRVTDEDKKDLSESSSDVETMTSPKESQVAATLKWLAENYELAEGVCLPRCVLYTHYLDLCKRQGFKPAGAATFGKLIRQKFKNITTRRLGTRGQSKYHYYGIGIKETSVYYQAVYTGKGLTRFSGVKIKTEGTCRKYSLSSKTGTLLPEFPDAHNLILPDSTTTHKMNTFIMMYRTHSQRILDTVITANFEEIQNLLLHFWQGYPQHLHDVLQLPVTCDVVAICDSILYKVLLDVLVPNAIQDLPESLTSDLRAFLKNLPHWMDNSLDHLIPQAVRKVKTEVLQQFIRSLTRQLAFIKMAQTARPQMTAVEVTGRAVTDLDNIDFEQMCIQTSFAVSDKSLVNCDKAAAVFEDMKTLLRKQSQIESFTEWIDGLIDKCVLQSSDVVSENKFQDRAGRLLLQWSMFGALIMKDLTLNNARSFSFLHVLKMTFDEYILLVVETQTDKHKDVQLQKNLQKHMKTAEEIKMNAKVRTQANKIQTSPKVRKRKIQLPPESDDELEVSDTEDHCPSLQQTSHYESVTAFSRPLPSQPAHRASVDTSTGSSSHCRSMARTTAFNPASLPLSPVKHFPAYDRSPYVPAFSFSPYNDYVTHTNAFVPQRSAQAFSDHATSQTFHPMGFTPGVNPTPSAAAGYWADPRPHQSTGLTDSYAQIGYSNYPQTFDTYKKSPFLRSSMYPEGLTRSNPTMDGLTRSNPTFDSLPRSNPTFDGLTRASSTLDTLARPNPTFDPARSAMYYTPDTIQVASSLAVGHYGNSFMDMTPPGSQYPRQDGRLYQEDMLASNMAAASGLTGFSKSYLPGGFR